MPTSKRPPRAPRPQGSQPPFNSSNISAELTAAARRLSAHLKLSLPPTRSALRYLLLTFGVVNVLSALAPQLMLCQPSTLARGYLWTIPLAPFVLPPSSALMPLLLLGYLGYVRSGAVTGRVLDRGPLWESALVWLGLWSLSLVFGGVVWSLALTSVLIIWFGEPLSRARLRGAWSDSWRSLMSPVVVSLLIALSAGLVMGLLSMSRLSGPLTGDLALTRPLLAIWAARNPSAHLALINMKAGSLKWVLLAFSLFELALSPSPTTLSGLAALIAVLLWLESKPRRYLS